MIKDFLLVGAGGLIGAMLRFAVSVAFNARNMATFPYATLVVNAAGCLAIGAVSVWIEKNGSDAQNVYTFVAVGLLGGFTTFSAFSLETLNLLQNQLTSLAIFNILANVAIGIGAVWAGRVLLA